MAKKQGGGKLLSLPFTAFGELSALGLEATVYCPCCYEHRSIDPTADHLRDRCFATTRFRCIKIRHTGNVSRWQRLWLPWVGDDQANRSIAARRRRHARLSVLRHVRAIVGDQPCADRQVAVVGGEPRRQRPLQVPGVREGRSLAYPRPSLAAGYGDTSNTLGSA